MSLAVAFSSVRFDEMQSRPSPRNIRRAECARVRRAGTEENQQLENSIAQCFSVFRFPSADVAANGNFFRTIFTFAFVLRTSVRCALKLLIYFVISKFEWQFHAREARDFRRLSASRREGQPRTTKSTG